MTQKKFATFTDFPRGISGARLNMYASLNRSQHQNFQDFQNFQNQNNHSNILNEPNTNPSPFAKNIILQTRQNVKISQRVQSSRLDHEAILQRLSSLQRNGDQTGQNFTQRNLMSNNKGQNQSVIRERQPQQHNSTKNNFMSDNSNVIKYLKSVEGNNQQINQNKAVQIEKIGNRQNMNILTSNNTKQSTPFFHIQSQNQQEQVSAIQQNGNKEANLEKKSEKNNTLFGGSNMNNPLTTQKPFNFNHQNNLFANNANQNNLFANNSNLLFKAQNKKEPQAPTNPTNQSKPNFFTQNPLTQNLSSDNNKKINLFANNSQQVKSLFPAQNKNLSLFSKTQGSLLFTSQNNPTPQPTNNQNNSFSLFNNNSNNPNLLFNNQNNSSLFGNKTAQTNQVKTISEIKAAQNIVGEPACQLTISANKTEEKSSNLTQNAINANVSLFGRQNNTIDIFSKSNNKTDNKPFSISKTQRNQNIPEEESLVKNNLKQQIPQTKQTPIISQDVNKKQNLSDQLKTNPNNNHETKQNINKPNLFALTTQNNQQKSNNIFMPNNQFSTKINNIFDTKNSNIFANALTTNNNVFKGNLLVNNNPFANVKTNNALANLTANNSPFKAQINQQNPFGLNQKRGSFGNKQKGEDENDEDSEGSGSDIQQYVEPPKGQMKYQYPKSQCIVKLQPLVFKNDFSKDGNSFENISISIQMNPADSKKSIFVKLNVTGVVLFSAFLTSLSSVEFKSKEDGRMDVKIYKLIQCDFRGIQPKRKGNTWRILFKATQAQKAKTFISQCQQIIKNSPKIQQNN